MVEYAHDARSAGAAPAWLERSLSIVHPSIIAGINRRRELMGLPLVRTRGDAEATLTPRPGGGFVSVPSPRVQARWAAQERAIRQIEAEDAECRRRAALRRPATVARKSRPVSKPASRPAAAATAGARARALLFAKADAFLRRHRRRRV